MSKLYNNEDKQVTKNDLGKDSWKSLNGISNLERHVQEDIALDNGREAVSWNSDARMDTKEAEDNDDTKETEWNIRPLDTSWDDIDYTHPENSSQHETRRLSYHDSDSDLAEYDLRSRSSFPGADLDKSDADSWDWTFHDENVSDLDIKTVPLPPKKSKLLTHISEDSSSEAVEVKTDPCHPEVEIDNTAHINYSNQVRKDADKNTVTADTEQPLLNTNKLEDLDMLDRDEYKDALPTFQSRPNAFDNAHGTEHQLVNAEIDTDEENIVYFQGSSSSHVLKTRLKYLHDNCSVRTKTRKSLTVQLSEDSKAKKMKRHETLHTSAAKTMQDFEKRNHTRKVTKLGDAEAKFVYSGHHVYDNPVRMVQLSQVERSFSSSFLPGSSKSQCFLPPLSNKGVDLLPRRKRYLNDALSEKLNCRRLNRGRVASRSDLFVKRVTTEDVNKKMVDHQSLRRYEKRTGIERFRHFARMIVIMLKAVGMKLEKPEETNYNFLSWTVVYDEVLGISRLNYDSGALSFDPLMYKANKESTLSQETKDILRLPSDQRTEAHIHFVMISFHNVIPSFSEFPKGIQQSMIKVCTYEKFEAGRVIIRQGHRAENFYFIISGCAVVTQMDSGANHVHTTNVLGKGNSFGELAFLHMSKRSATVTCRDDVELLCIEREDFIDIFMRPHKGEEPDHINFLKSIDLLQGWPVTLLPHANPKICAFTYVRRGVILCHDGAKSDWIVIIYSGSCKVLKALDVGPVTRHEGKTELPESRNVSLAPNSSSFSKVYTTSACNSSNNVTTGGLQQPEHQVKRARKQGLAFPAVRSVQNQEDVLTDGKGGHIRLSEMEHLKDINEIFYKKHILPKIRRDHHSEQDKNNDTSPKKVSFHKPVPPPTNSIFKPKRQSYGFQPPALPQFVVPKSDTPSNTPSKQQLPVRKTAFIEITRLESGDIFGLEHVVLAGIRDVASCSLISEGAEVVLVSKTFFQNHLTEDTMKRMRQTIRPLPSEKSLQKKYENQKLWEAYKAETLARQTKGDRKLGTKLQTL